MPLKLIRGDITKLECDAIVNAANNSLLGGGGVDGAIHKAAGRGLLNECRKLGGCETGDAKLTKGYKLPCRYVIHAVGPVWEGGNKGEEKLLRSCYRRSLELAEAKGCGSLAFPLISSGIFGYPKDQALRVATDEIVRFLAGSEMLVYIVVFDKDSFDIGERLFGEIEAFIDDSYAIDAYNAVPEYRRAPMMLDVCMEADEDQEVKIDRRAKFLKKAESSSLYGAQAAETNASTNKYSLARKNTLEDELKNIDESFSEMLLRKIDENGMTDVECYKRANVDRKLFSKIRSDRLYRPSKTTAIAFVIALKLPLDEAKDMLMKAGYALSRSNKFDIIIEYFIVNANYDIFEINEALFKFDQNLLGV